MTVDEGLIDRIAQGMSTYQDAQDVALLVAWHGARRGQPVRCAILDRVYGQALDRVEDLVRLAALRADGLLDSMAIGTLADALHLLARAGRVIIVRESGRRVLARFADAC